MTELEIKLADALSRERLVRSIGQDPNVHWESIRDLRRECYAQTDEALAAYEQAQTATPAPAEPEDRKSDVKGALAIALAYATGEEPAWAATPAPAPRAAECWACNGTKTVTTSSNGSGLIDEACSACAATPAPAPLTDQARRAIGSWLNTAMTQAVEAGANSISMPDEYVEIAAWLAGQGKEAGK